MSQMVIQETLLEKFNEIKGRNGHFSQRAYAKKLGVSSGTLSLIMNGKRKISKKLAVKFATNLELQGDELERFFSIFSNSDKPNQQAIEIEYVELQMKQYKVVTEWYHFAILSLLKLDDFESNITWISLRLGLSEIQVDKAIERLVQTKLIKIEAGNYIRTYGNIHTSDGIKNSLLRNAHKNNLEIASRKLDEVDVDQRDYTAVTMAIDPNQLPEAKKMIRTFHDNISNLLESGQKSEVYKICIQLFPLTNIRGPKCLN